MVLVEETADLAQIKSLNITSADGTSKSFTFDFGKGDQ